MYGDRAKHVWEDIILLEVLFLKTAITQNSVAKAIHDYAQKKVPMFCKRKGLYKEQPTFPLDNTANTSA